MLRHQGRDSGLPILRDYSCNHLTGKFRVHSAKTPKSIVGINCYFVCLPKLISVVADL